MSAVRFAILITAVGYVALVIGCALLAPWLALVVGGALLMAAGFLIDEPKQPPKARGGP